MICTTAGKVRLTLTPLADLAIVNIDYFEDDRGFFLEVFRADEFEKVGLPTQFLQENHSRSKKGVVRGLHFQWDRPMARLISAPITNTSGSVRANGRCQRPYRLAAENAPTPASAQCPREIWPV